MKFKSSRKEKAGVADQLTFQLLMLIDGDLLRVVECIAIKSSEIGLTFQEFYREVGFLLYTVDYS